MIREELEILNKICNRLDQILALLLIHGKDMDTQIKILYSLDFNASFISSILGIASSTVRGKKRKLKGISQKASVKK